MKRFNILTKYSVIFFAILLIIFIILSKFIDVSNQALLVSAITALTIYFFSVLFIFKEVNTPLKKIFYLSNKLKLKEDSGEFNHFDKKISEINELIEELDKLKSGSVLNKEIYEIPKYLLLIFTPVSNFEILIKSSTRDFNLFV